MFITYKLIRKLNLFFKLCLSWGLELDEVNLLNREKNLLFPGEWNFIIVKGLVPVAVNGDLQNEVIRTSLFKGHIYEK